MKYATKKLAKNLIQASILVPSLIITLMSSVSANAELTILTVGDSITSGLKLNGSRTSFFCPADGVLTSSFYVCNGDAVLNQGGFQPDIVSLFAQKDISASTYNWGFAGEESWQIINRVTQAMDSRPADTVFFMAGVNDLNDNLSDEATAFNVIAMMDLVIDRGLTPIVGTITPHLGDSSYNPKIVRINELIRTAANEREIVVAEHYQTLISNWGVLNSGDGLHVADSGDAIIATNWVEAYELSLTLNQKITLAPIIQLLLSD